MIVVETKKIDNIDYKYTYSDEDYMIQKVGTDEIYTEAIDKLDSTFTYIETDEPINNEEEDATEEDYIEALNDLGVSE